jgi:hypothetical protein
LVVAATTLLAVQLFAVGPAEARSRDKRRDDGGRRVERPARVQVRSSRFSDNRWQHDRRQSRSYVDSRRGYDYRNRTTGGFEHDIRRGPASPRYREFNRDDRWRRHERHDGYVGAPGPVIRHRSIVRYDDDFDRHRDRQRYVRPYPVYVHPRPVIVAPRPVVYVPTPVVVYPHPTTIVTGPQFILRGRAPIGSHVFVEVVAVFGGAVYPVTYDTYVDPYGGFSLPIRSAHYGAQHRIKVWSVMSGVHSAPAGLVVYWR